MLIEKIKPMPKYIEKLIKKLDSSDFFFAPASTQYHNSFRGGLCDHCLNVCSNMLRLVEMNAESLGIDVEDVRESVIIVSLLHDISKMNLYEVGVKNEKVYSENGSKYDELGKFDWVSKRTYKTREDKFVYGSHEATSEYMARQFIPLTIDESIAIIHHMGSMAWDSAKDNIGEVFNNYWLALLLYQADMMSTYINERC
jgi:hypothetical protein